MIHVNVFFDLNYPGQLFILVAFVHAHIVFYIIMIILEQLFKLENVGI